MLGTFESTQDLGMPGSLPRRYDYFAAPRWTPNFATDPPGLFDLLRPNGLVGPGSGGRIRLWLILWRPSPLADFACRVGPRAELIFWLCLTEGCT